MEGNSDYDAARIHNEITMHGACLPTHGADCLAAPQIPVLLSALHPPTPSVPHHDTSPCPWAMVAHHQPDIITGDGFLSPLLPPCLHESCQANGLVTCQRSLVGPRLEMKSQLQRLGTHGNKRSCSPLRIIINLFFITTLPCPRKKKGG